MFPGSLSRNSNSLSPKLACPSVFGDHGTSWGIIYQSSTSLTIIIRVWKAACLRIDPDIRDIAVLCLNLFQFEHISKCYVINWWKLAMNKSMLFALPNNLGHWSLQSSRQSMAWCLVLCVKWWYRHLSLNNIYCVKLY